MQYLIVPAESVYLVVGGPGGLGVPCSGVGAQLIAQLRARERADQAASPTTWRGFRRPQGRVDRGGLDQAGQGPAKAGR